MFAHNQRTMVDGRKEEEWKFTVNTEATTAGEKKTGIPFNLYGQSGAYLDVDWGDGTSSHLTSALYAQNNSTASVHEYAQAGEYQVTVKSKSWDKTPIFVLTDNGVNFSQNNLNSHVYFFKRTLVSLDNAIPKVKKVMTTASSSPTTTSGVLLRPDATNVSYMFSRCKQLTTIYPQLFYNNPQITNFSCCFKQCTSLTQIPATLFQSSINASDFGSCFSYCTSLLSIPAELFSGNAAAVSFAGCFVACINLQSIPNELFSACPNVTSFAETFRNCNNLESIPNGIFSACPNVTSFSQTFGSSYNNGLDGVQDKNNTKLTSIPQNLFKNNVRAVNFQRCFARCSNIASIPAGLFDNNIAATTFTGCFAGCASLQSIPEGLFDKNTAATAFGNSSSYQGGCFESCTSLQSIPSELFDKNTAVTDFSRCFYKCTSIQSIPAELFSKNTAATSFNGCFEYCSSIQSIPSGLFDSNTTVTDFGSCFYSCTSIEYIPSGLFSHNTEATNFQYCFFDCESLKNFKLVIGSPLVFSFSSFVSASSNVTRIVCVPSNSQTYTTITAYAAIGENKNNITVSTIDLTCADVLVYTVNTEATNESSRTSSVPIEPIANAEASLSIDWGDGTAVELPASNVLSENLIHTYQTAGTYQITAYSDNWEDYKFQILNSDGFSSDDPTPGAVLKAFRETVVSIDDALPAFKNTELAYWFTECKELKTVPADLFIHFPDAENAKYCFNYCNSLQSIPIGLFKTNTAIEDFSHCFANCGSISSIPSKLFSNCASAETFEYCFYNCRNIESIPTGLFNRNTAATNFSKCFQSCSSLNSVPSGLFANNTAAVYFGNCFSNTSLTQFKIIIGSSHVEDALYFVPTSSNTNRIICVPDNSDTRESFFYYISGQQETITLSTIEADCIQTMEYTVTTNITDNGWMPDRYNPLVAAVPVEPVQNALARLMIDWGDGTAVELQPSEVTESNLIHTYAEAGTYQITVGSNNWGDYSFMAVEFNWDSDRTSDNPRIQTFRDKLISLDGPLPPFSNDNVNYWFYDCIFLTSIDGHLFDNMSAVTSAHRCFGFCENLPSIPSTLFAKNAAITDFSECFRNCDSIASIPSNLFANNTAAVTFDGCFIRCHGITTIPETLFANNAAVKDFGYCFDYCSRLQTVPSNLFANNTAVTSFYSCFDTCGNLGGFTLHIGSSVVSTAESFVDKKSGVTRTVYVPSGSTTQTTFNALSSSLGLTVTGE